MQLLGRILVVAAAVGGPAVVLAIGCNVETSGFPGLANETPNLQGIPVLLPSTTGAGGSTTTSTTSSAVLPAASVCDCAYSQVSGLASCNTCMSATCATEYTACQGDPNCPTMGTSCVFNCGTDGSCISGCIDSNVNYANLVSCLFNMGCAGSCDVAATITPCSVTLPVADAGTD